MFFFPFLGGVTPVLILISRSPSPCLGCGSAATFLSGSLTGRETRAVGGWEQFLKQMLG